MVTPSKTIRRSLVCLKLPQNKVPALINYAQQIVKSMTGNAAFATPNPTLAALTQAIDELEAAENAVLARTRGAAAMRNEKRMALVMLLEQLRSYVQSIADANVENGGSIIQSAGLGVRRVPARKPRVFDAVPGPTTGTAKLIAASAARRASYEWQTSTDAGKTWVPAPSTLQAKTTVVGLAAGTTVQFRYRAITRKGEGDWSQPVWLLVK